MLKIIVHLILVYLILVVMFFGIVAGVDIYFEYNTCETLQNMHDDNLEFQWVFYGGCRVKTPSGYWLHHTDMEFIEAVLQNE